MPGFAHYKQTVLTLVGNLKQLQNFAEKLHLEKQIPIIDHTITRIETDSFSIAVVGEFKRGKSTFINAILGNEILPADVLPTTATLNRVTYGAKPLVKIIFKDNEERDIDIDKLVSFVTKLTPECEAVAATVKEAVICYPVNYCRHNVEIIDTPGLSDDENMTAVTLSALEKVEVAIMVTSVLAPFCEHEGNFTTQKLLTTNLSQIIFVVTGIDYYQRHQDIEKVLKTVKQRIKSCVENWAEANFERNSPTYKNYLNKVGNIRVFGISSYQALLAKINKDEELLAKSRFLEFEYVLQKIVSENREKIRLQSFINQEIATATEVIKSLNNKKNQLALSCQEFEHKLHNINELIINFQDTKTQKILQINATIEQIKSQVISLINQLESQLKQSSEQIIDSLEINLSNNINHIINQVADQVDQALQNASQSIATEIQTIISTELSTVLQPVNTLLFLAFKVMQTVEAQLEQIAHNMIVIQHSSSAINNSLNQALQEFNQEHIEDLANLFPSSSEAFLWKNEDNSLYTIVAGIAGSVFGPVGMAVGVAVGTGIGNSQKIKKFKKNYKLKVVSEIENQWRLHNPNQIVDDYLYAVKKSVDKLKNRIGQELNEWIEETQNTIAKIQGQQQASLEREEKIINEMLHETQNILNHAWTLSEELYQTMQVDQEENLEIKICPNCSYKNAADSNFCIKCGTKISDQ